MKSINELDLDPNEILRKSPAELWGIDKYLWLVDNIKKIDEANLENYAKVFRSYWGVHTSTEGIARGIKKARNDDEATFKDICEVLSEKSLEKVTASKILGVLDPEKYPIWDSAVSEVLKIGNPTGSFDEKLNTAHETYKELIENYDQALKSAPLSLCNKLIGVFDEKFRDYPNIENMSNMKKVDFFIWASIFPILK